MKKWWGTVKKIFPALRAGNCAPPLSNCFRRHCTHTKACNDNRRLERASPAVSACLTWRSMATMRPLHPICSTEDAGCSYIPKVVCIYWVTAWIINANFHTLITCLYLHTQAERRLIISCCCKVTDFFQTTS